MLRSPESFFDFACGRFPIPFRELIGNNIKIYLALLTQEEHIAYNCRNHTAMDKSLLITRKRHKYENHF